MQIILKTSRLCAQPRLLLCTSVAHRQDGEIAGHAKPRPNRLGSVKRPID